MRNSTFVIPHLRGHGFLLTTVSDPAIGGDPDPGDLDAVDVLLQGWSGLLRGVALAGYRCVELSVEIDPGNAVERLLCDPAILGAGITEIAVEGLGEVRAQFPAMMVALALDPLRPFGEAAGAPIAIDLPTAAIQFVDGVFAPVSRNDQGEIERVWIAFTSSLTSLTAARDQLIAAGVAVSEALIASIADAWARQPDPRGEPTGLGFLFDHQNWWFPPLAPDRPDTHARNLAYVLGAVAEPLHNGTVAIPSFLTEQIVRRRDPKLFTPGGSFANVTRAHTSTDPSVGIDAYSDRLAGLVVADVGKALVPLTDLMDDRFTWTDAVMLMIEHGAVGVAHNLLPGVPSTSLSGMPLPSTPEWTVPRLTGQWDATPEGRRLDTLILNQSGTSISGFWQLHHTGNVPLERWQLSGTQLSGNRNGGPLTFDVEVWPQPGPEDQGPSQTTISGQLVVTAHAGAVPTMSFDVDIGRPDEPGYLFAKTLGPVDDSHATEASMFKLTDSHKAKLRTLRDAPLHYMEVEGSVVLLKIAADHIVRYLEEQPDFEGLRDLLDEFLAGVEANRAAIPMYNTAELLATSGFYIKQALAKVSTPGGADALSKLVEMFRLAYTWPSCLELQRLYDLVFFPDGYDLDIQYQWRITNVTMDGKEIIGGAAIGTGTFELQRVDENGTRIGAVTSRTIDLQEFIVNAHVIDPTNPVAKVDSLPVDLSNWMMLWPTNRDVVPSLDGAQFSLMGFGGGIIIFESTGTMEVEIAPTDHMPPLRGYVSPGLSVPIFDPLGDDATPDDVKDRAEGIKGLIDDLKEIAKEVREKGAKGIKSAKSLLKPHANFTSVDGWIRNASGTSFVPDVLPVPVDTYSEFGDTWARFDRDEYELTGEFRDAIRRFLLDHLPLFTSIGEVTIEGNASQLGPDDYNIRLSRDRACSVLTAMYDILGPQLATPWGDLVVRGLGSLHATGEPESDVAIDRRVDVIIRGAVRLRS